MNLEKPIRLHLITTHVMKNSQLESSSRLFRRLTLCFSLLPTILGEFHPDPARNKNPWPCSPVIIAWKNLALMMTCHATNIFLLCTTARMKVSGERPTKSRLLAKGCGLIPLSARETFRQPLLCLCISDPDLLKATPTPTYSQISALRWCFRAGSK